MDATSPWTSTAVRADQRVPGRWHADVDDIWVTAMVPLGGLCAAVATRALQAELHAHHPPAVDQPLRSIHCLFAAPVPAGPLEADVTVLRAGRTMSQAQVALRAPDATIGLHALAAFGAPRLGYEFVGARPPEVPAPEDCRSFRDPPPPEAAWQDRPSMALWDQILDGRGAIGLPPWDRSPRSTAESATWYRFDDPPLDEHGRMDQSGLFVIGDMMLGAVGQRIGFTDQPWFGPSVDLTMHFFDTPGPGWLLSHNTARRSVEGYGSVETHLWEPGVGGAPWTLVAYATQQMFFTFPEGAPPPEDLVL